MDYMRATVITDCHNNNRFRITGWAPENIINTPTHEQQEEAKKEWMVQQIYHRDEEEWIIHQLQTQQQIMIVSDGSYHPDYQVGTSAWVITSSTDTTRRIYADNIVPGDRHIQCPHRSELCGLIGAVQHIQQICKNNNINEGRVALACDGLEAYKIATRFNWTHTTNIGHFDMVTCLHQLLRNSNITWTFRHVKGHQDKNMNIADIDIWGQLNMVADSYAKIALWRNIESNGREQQMEQLHHAIQPITIEYKEYKTTIVSNLRKRLSHHISQQRILHYWKEQGKQVDNDNFDKLAFTHAARNIPIYLQTWITKWSSGICGVGKWLERWKDQPHSKCPRCLTDNETVEHVIHCQHEDATLCWNTGIEEIRDWMMTHNALPGLAEAVCTRLSQWRNNRPLANMEFLDDSVASIIQDQDDMGWDAVMFGTLHNSWSREQGDYLSALGKRTTDTTWVSQFICKIWILQHSLWVHRNSFVHKDGKSMHQHEEEAVDRVIREEFLFGRYGLPTDYEGLFRGNVHRILNGAALMKVQWLYRVWSGRDRLRREQDMDPWYKDPLAATFIRRHQVRRKRKRRYDVLDDG